MLALTALLLQPAPVRPRVATPGPTPAARCASLFNIGFVTDIAQLDSTVDAEGWAGVRAATTRRPCLQAELIRSTDPTAYQRNLERAADDHDLVIAGSFLLTDAALAAARSRPGSRFVLVDPLVLQAPQPNLAVISFREDQAAFLAGALAALVTKSRILGGVYGLEGGAMNRYRQGFEQGVAAIDPSIRVLGAYQPASQGAPFGNPGWGEQQANQWLADGADLIFGAGGLTGEGALHAASAAHRRCLGAGADGYATDPSVRSCLLSSAISRVDRAVEIEVLFVSDGQWTAGPRVFGLAEGGVGLAPFHQFEATVTAAMRRRLDTLAAQLAGGTLLDLN